MSVRLAPPDAHEGQAVYDSDKTGYRKSENTLDKHGPRFYNNNNKCFSGKDRSLHSTSPGFRQRPAFPVPVHREITMRTMTGYITSVQEERFRLLTDDGRGLLLTLHHNCPLSNRDLRRLEQANARIMVEFDGEPGLASAVAYCVRRLNSQGAAQHTP